MRWCKYKRNSREVSEYGYESVRGEVREEKWLKLCLTRWEVGQVRGHEYERNSREVSE